LARVTKIDYEQLVQDSLRAVVRDVLAQTAAKGLPAQHHFYISFKTDFLGVDLPDYLKQQYPEEITIVLQYEYWDLEVEDDRFFVTLCFNDIHERLTVPFNAIVSFVDPSVKFGLQFVPTIHEKALPEKLPKKPKAKAKGKDKEKAKMEPVAPTLSQVPTGSNVVMLDAFRKKK
jgi:hypothetical protein